MSVAVHHGDCVEALVAMEGEGRLFDSCVCDPPYHLTSIVKRFGADGAAPCKAGKTGAYQRASAGFMGKKWDGGDVAFRPETWRAVFDVLKPGAHLIAFGGTRNHHRMFCAIEDAGFEIRDTIFWCYGSGFPKSHDVSKGIDRLNGDERPVTGKQKVRDIRNGHGRGLGDGINAAERAGPEYQDRELTSAASAASAAWEGWGTALKPALEPICLARKPLSEKSIAANVLKWGTGAINVDGCRVEAGGEKTGSNGYWGMSDGKGWNPNNVPYKSESRQRTDLGRWPANLCHDGSEEVLAGFPDSDGSGPPRVLKRSAGNRADDWGMNAAAPDAAILADAGSGSAARFFYSAKAGPLDRLGSAHPTVKPVDLMRWLVRMVTPPGGTVLDPFAGSGSTGIAAIAEGFSAELIDIEEAHVADIRRKLAILEGDGAHMLTEQHRNRKQKPLGGLFEGAPA